MDRVSVIIPTYNRQEALNKAVNSVIKQTHKNLEIIIVDDSDTPCTYPKDSRIIYIHNPKKMGVNASRNIGIKEATGAYIAFLDDDDTWMDFKIEKQLSIFKENPNVGLVISFIDDMRFEEEYIDKYPERITLYQILRMFRLSSTSSYMFDSVKLREIGYFDIRLPSAQEYDLAIRMASKYLVKCYQSILVIQNRSDGQITTNWKAKRDGLKMIYLKHKPKYRHYGMHLFFHFRIRFLIIRFLYYLAGFFGIKVYRIIIPMKKGSVRKCQ